MSAYGKDNNDILKLVGGSIDIKEVYSKVLDLAYPINSIYMSTNSTSPAILFGGTWEQLKDRFLLGAGGSYGNGSTGGEINVTITTATMPAHGHSLKRCSTNGSHKHGVKDIESLGNYYLASNRVYNVVTSASKTTETSSSAGSHKHTVGINNTGGGGAHNNMPPYFMVYIWKRVA